MRATDPIVNQFIEPDHEFDFNPLNRNLCFGGSKKPGTGGAFLPDFGINTEQEMFTVNEKLKPNTDQARGSTFETLNKAVTDLYPGLMRERDKALSQIFGDYGSTQGDTGGNTDPNTGNIPEEENPPPTTEMTPEERRNNLRRLMASRYGRAQTVLTGGTGISDFGI